MKTWTEMSLAEKTVAMIGALATIASYALAFYWIMLSIGLWFADHLDVIRRLNQSSRKLWATIRRWHESKTMNEN